jgi:hypothetical protein
MAITIQLASRRARVQHRQWSGDADLVELLQGTLDPDGPTGSDPDPDRTAAELAAQKFGVVIIAADSPARAFDESVVY